MKKKMRIVLLVLLTIPILFGCQGKQNQSSDVEKSKASSETTAQSSDLITYLQTDDTKSSIYNNAIKAYNEFLNGKIDAKDTNTNSTININEMNNINGASGISSFALFDVNGDGIPELHPRSIFHDVFSYQSNHLLHWYTSFNLMDGYTIVLANGAIFSTHDSTGTEYNYTTFDPEGVTSTIKFEFIYINDDNIEYFFQNKKVFKKEYDTLIKEYMDLSKKPAAIEWYNYQ